MNDFFYNICKALACLLCGLMTYLEPTVPYVLVLFFAIMVDCFSAWRLTRRIKRNHPEIDMSDKFESKKSWEVFPKMLVQFCLIEIAHSMDTSIFIMFDMYLANWMAGALCLYEMLSILENESSENKESWAVFLQKFLVNKASRHVEELKESFETLKKTREDGNKD